MNSSRAFTLPEILITTVVAALVGSLLLLILVNNTGLFFQQSSRVQQGLGSNDALAKVRSSVKEAKVVSAGYPEPPPYTYTSSATQLVLKLPTVDLSGNVVTSTFDYVVYSVVEGRLYFKLFPNAQSQRKVADQILSTNVDSLLFSYFNSSGLVTSPTNAVKVKATLILKQKAGLGFEVSTATSEANLRND